MIRLINHCVVKSNKNNCSISIHNFIVFQSQCVSSGIQLNNQLVRQCVLLSERFEVVNDLADVGVDEVERVLNGAADVALHHAHDGIVEDTREHADHGVHQPVGQDVAGQADAEATVNYNIKNRSPEWLL